MRKACHHNPYAIANSCGMNGVSKDTTINPTQPTVVAMVTIINCALAFFLLVFIVMWVLGIATVFASFMVVVLTIVSEKYEIF